MTGVEAAIDRLEQIAPLTTLVNDRIYNSVAPQGCASPFVVVRNVSDMRDHHLRGLDDLGLTRVQVDAYVDEASGADAKGQANAVAQAIFGDGNGPTATGLCGWIGAVGGSPATGRVSGVFYAGRFEGVEFDERRRWYVRQDFMVHWKALS